jgi:hypothetical protein
MSVPPGVEQGDPILADVVRNARSLMAPRK